MLALGLRGGRSCRLDRVALAADNLDLHVDTVQLGRDRLHDPDHDVLQSRPLRVVVQHELAVRLRAAERRSPHARVERAQVVVQRIQVLEEVTRRRTEHLQDLVVARVLAELEERLAEQLQDVAGGNVCPYGRKSMQIEEMLNPMSFQDPTSPNTYSECLRQPLSGCT